MNIHTEKIKVAQMLLSTESKAIINQVKAILNAQSSPDLWDELTDYQKSVVKEAKKQIEKGEGLPHKEVMKKYKKWLTK